MSKKSDHIANSEKDFLRYTENKMSDKERNAFEKNLQKEPFDSEALEGLSSLPPEEIKADISKMKRGLFQKSDSSNRFVLYRYAAGIAVIITISSLFYIMLNRKISDEQNTIILTESAEKRNDENLIPEPAKEAPVMQGDKKTVLPAQNTVKPEKIQSPIITEADTEIQAVQAEFHKIKSVDSVPLASTPVEKKEEQPQFERTSASKSFGERADNKREIASTAKSPPKAYSGRIVSSDDFQPLPGASVVIKGTNSGTLTDSDGIFMLPPLPEIDTSVTLQVAFIGMEEQEIPANAGKDLQIVLNPSEVSLDEVVVVGFGADRKTRTKKSDVIESIPAKPMEGQKVFDDYISEHQIFPGKDSTVSDAKVVLEFLVDKSGKPYDIKVNMMFPVDSTGRPYNPLANESPGKEFADEAIRLLTNGPKWKAASPSTFKTRIIITLSKN